MPLEKGQAPLEKGQTYIEHFPAREDALLISESGCVPPEVMVLNTNPLVLFTISQNILIPYGQILNQTDLRRPPGIQARQGNSQNHLKGSEGLEGNHPDASANPPYNLTSKHRFRQYVRLCNKNMQSQGEFHMSM